MIFLNSLILETFKGKSSGGGYKRDKNKINSRGNVGISFGGVAGDRGGGYRREASEDKNGNFGRGDIEQVRRPSEQEKIAFERRRGLVQKRGNDNYRGKRM